MTKIDCQQITADEEQILKLTISFDQCDYKEIALAFVGIEGIVATTEGTINGNDVFINKAKKKIEVFVKPIGKTVTINTTYLSGEKTIHHDSSSVESNLARKEKECKPLTIFTGDKKFELFNEKIKNRLIPDWSVSFKESEEGISIRVENNKISTLVCFGVLSSTVTAKDVSFILDADIEAVILPWDFLLHHFSGQEVALHLLVKPDFQKKINNIYYKSQISDAIKIPDKKLNLRRLKEFKSPVGQLDASKWVMNYESQFPEYVDS